MEDMLQRNQRIPIAFKAKGSEEKQK